MQEAVDRSKQYDAAFGNKLSVDKCAVVAQHSDASSLALASAIDFKLENVMELCASALSACPQPFLIKMEDCKAIALSVTDPELESLRRVRQQDIALLDVIHTRRIHY